MKKQFAIIIFILLIVAIGAVSILSAKRVQNKTQEVVKIPDNTVIVSSIPTTGKFCFARVQKATDTAPYSVEEHVVLNFAGTKVTGTKKGTQAGPDMTNGYSGTLDGATILENNEMELTYSYTVEGSQNRELEVYTIANNPPAQAGNLIKKRWVLKETKINNQSILVPDYSGDPTLITYEPEVCAS